jgi:hypothetical protein
MIYTATAMTPLEVRNLKIIPPVKPGFFCPICGFEMGVYWSRKVAPGCVVRMRLCDKCGNKTKTTES